MPVSISSDSVPLHRKSLQKGESDLGISQHNNDLVSTCDVQSNSDLIPVPRNPVVHQYLSDGC